jgi:hypothetical protein
MLKIAHLLFLPAGEHVEKRLVHSNEKDLNAFALLLEYIRFSEDRKHPCKTVVETRKQVNFQ